MKECICFLGFDTENLLKKAFFSYGSDIPKRTLCKKTLHKYIKIIVNEQAKLKQHVNESGHKSISVLLQSIYSFGYSVSMLYYARKKEIIDMSKFRLKELGKKCMAALLVLTIFAGTSNYVFAASDSTKNVRGHSYTRWVGPAKSAKYVFSIDGNKYAGTKKNTIEYKDPTLSHVGLVMYLKHGQSRTDTYYYGSSSAYYRGYVQYGYVKVKA